MKKIYGLIIASLIGTAPAMAQHEVECDFTSISSNITSNTTLSASTLYRLEGCIHVTSGNTLTIPAGTTIMGEKASGGTLIIDRGGQLVSQGTAMNPVVFTSDQVPAWRAPNDWGGIAVLGYAKNNQSNSITLSTNRDCSVTGGGTNNSDNSGVFKYMRIEYPRYGLSMNSVGNGTEFHHVEVLNAAENSLELYGGTVNFKHFISVNAKRSDILATHGNLSKGQYILGLRLDPLAYVSTGDLSNGIVFANNNDAGSNYASSAGADDGHTVLSNVSLFGPGYCGSTSYNSNFKYGVLFYHNAGGGVYNSIITGWREGLRLEDFAKDNADINYTVNASENTYYNNLQDYNPLTVWPANCATDIDDWMLGTSPSSCRQRNNQFSPTELGLSSTICGDFCTTSPSFVLNTSASGYDLAIPHYNLAADLSNVFFDAASYRGAFDNATDWSAGWANYCIEDISYCPEERRVGGTTGIKGMNIADNNGLILSPNPVHGITYAEFATEQAGQVTVTVVNSVGQVVRTLSHNATKGKQRVAVSTDGLSSGMYIINVDLSAGKAAHARVIVK
jgi:hypothetical protein